ncbi:hypothetical protein [uncultured Muribaculum sp.]|uniref:hypothetical protein n=1 Tax=uncultured Muribaculum sp. TaxID=1918613 RepID=UPI0025930DA2|nr:hypothetical protein [uncultured Muribaculum sp.]
MSRTIMLICAMSVFVMAYAETFSYHFNSTPLPKAIQLIMENHPDLDINFIYNELENYNTSATVNADNAYDAIRQAIGLNPVTVVKSKNTYYVEALQHGKFVYTGRAIGTDNEPVAAATVMLLAPKDSAVITYGITDSEGRFKIPCDERNVIGKLTCLGYRPHLKAFDSFAVGDVVMSALPINLKAVTVTGEQILTYSDRTVYRPTQRQKSTPMDAIDLLRRMAIPQINIKVFDNSVETTDGRPVAIFIDYTRATEEELKGLRAGDVRRVEFSYSPSDPRFMGETNVVNFILQSYRYGGYTKLMASESFFTGLLSDASVYSKFKYKSMTYDLFVASRNTNNHHTGSSGTSSYLLSPEAGKTEWVDRTQTTTGSHYVENTLPVTFRATYDSENFQAKNTLAFTYTDKPNDDNEGTVDFTPELFTPSTYATEKSSDVKSVGYYGSFFFSFPRRYKLTVYPSASYTHNIQNSHYTADETVILNNAREKATNLNLDASLMKDLGKNHNLYLSGFGGRTEYRVNYTGDYPAYDRLMTVFAGGTVKYGYYTNNFSADARIGVRYQKNRINASVEEELYPFGSVNVGWSPNRRHSINFYINYSKEPIPDNGKSPNVLRENEVLYYRGNPNLSYSKMLSTSLNYNWSAMPWLRVSPYIRFLGLLDRWTPVYSPYDDGRAILRSYENNGDHLWTTLGISATASFFDGNLQFQLMTLQDFYRATGTLPVTYNPFILISSVQYYMGNFYFSGYFNSPLTSLWSNYDTIIKTRSSLKLEAGWSKSDLNVRLTIANPFRTSWDYSTTKCRYEYYKDRMVNYDTRTHFSLQLSLAYTFGYGKKVNHGDEVGGAGTGSSAILK